MQGSIALRGTALQRTSALAVALILNALFLAALLFQQAPSRWLTPVDDAPSVRLALRRLPSLAPALPKAAPLAPPSRAVPAWAPSRSAAPSAPTPALPPTAVEPSTAPAAAATDADAQTAARAASALRHLGACSDFSVQARREAHCRQGWGDQGASVDALSPAARSAFAAQADDPEARRKRSAEVGSGLLAHGQGGGVYYGCALRHGKWECSTY